MTKLTGQLESIRTELHSAQQELRHARTQLQGVERERDDMAGKLATWEKRSSSLSGGHPILLLSDIVCHEIGTSFACPCPSPKPLPWLFANQLIKSNHCHPTQSA